MKKLILSLLIMFTSYPAFSQLSLISEINQGFEWNIFKNPDLVQSRQGLLDREQLWQNSIYNAFIIQTDYLKKTEQGRIKLSADLNLDRFHQQPTAHKNNYRVLASYRTKYASRRYIEFAPELNRQQQDGFDPNDLLFSGRLSYHQLDTPVHLDFYLGKKSWLKFESSYRYKVFDRFENNQAYYHMLSVEGEYKKKWESKTLISQISIYGVLKNRHQTSQTFETFQVPASERVRIFRAIETGTEISFKTINDRFDISFPFEFSWLSDAPTQNLNYRQLKAGVELGITLGKVQLDQKISGFLRDFDQFTVPNNEMLSYRFFRSSTSLEIPLYRNLLIHSKFVFMQRESNQRLSSDAYRGYLNSYIESGIRIEL